MVTLGSVIHTYIYTYILLYMWYFKTVYKLEYENTNCQAFTLNKLKHSIYICSYIAQAAFVAFVKKKYRHVKFQNLFGMNAKFNILMSLWKSFVCGFDANCGDQK